MFISFVLIQVKRTKEKINRTISSCTIYIPITVGTDSPAARLALQRFFQDILLTIKVTRILSQEILKNAFKDFFRGRTDIPGFRLELNLAKKIDSLHSMTIDVDSSPNTRTRVRIRFRTSKSINQSL